VVSYDEAQWYFYCIARSSSTEYQDVAVVEVNKSNLGRDYCAGHWDEALYGRNYIVEPSYNRTETLTDIQEIKRFLISTIIKYRCVRR
jgi:hypothetical protein